MAKKAEIEQTAIEAPYELPEGWKWCRLRDVCDSSKEKTETFSQETKYIGLEHIDSNGKINGWSPANEIKSLKNIFHKNQILYGKLRPYLNKHDIANFDGVCSTDILVFNAKDNFSNRYINYFFNLPYFIDFAVSNSNGINLPRVSEKAVLDMPFPLPPTLAEQQRIVNRIETMFAKLDQAQEKAQAVLNSFETRKAAILHKAFTGELTANWRKENEVNSNISESTFKDICTKITDGFHNSPKPVSKGYPYIMAGDIREDGIDFNNGLFMDEKNHKELYNKAHPEKGDILVVNIGAGTGKSAIIEVEFEFSFKNCAILKLNKEIVNSNYVYLFFNLKKDYILKEITRGGAQPFLSLKMINELSISYPPLAEQQEIVRILDTVLEKESRAKEAAQTVLEQIALLKKSILARAFRGEL